MCLAFCEQTDLPPVLDEAARARGFQLTDFLRLFQIEPETWPMVSESAVMLLAYLPNLTYIGGTEMPGSYAMPLPALDTAHVSSIPVRTLDIFD